jgi:hypothetical protein
VKFTVSIGKLRDDSWLMYGIFLGAKLEIILKPAKLQVYYFANFVVSIIF